MKYLIYSIIIGFVFIFSGRHVPAYASFEDDYQNYLKIYDTYRSRHTNYLATRNQYLQFRTLTAKNEALTAVKDFLIARDDVLLSHLSLLSQRNQNEKLKQTLTIYDSFLTSHKNRISSVGSLEDAVISSSEVESQGYAFATLSQEVVWNILIAKVDQLNQRFILLENEANGLITSLQASQKDVSLLERWLLDARGKRELAGKKILAAQNLSNALSDPENDNEMSGSIKLLLFEANQYLKEGISYLRELSETIKYGNY